MCTAADKGTVRLLFVAWQVKGSLSELRSASISKKELLDNKAPPLHQETDAGGSPVTNERKRYKSATVQV